MKQSGRYKIVSKYAPHKLHNIENEIPELLDNIKRYIVERPHLNPIINHWEETGKSADEIFASWDLYDGFKTVSHTMHNQVIVTFHFHGEKVAHLVVKIQPAFVKEYLDKCIRAIAADLQKKEDEKREQERIERETTEIQRKLYRGEL